jgi:hypothetical protein
MSAKRPQRPNGPPTTKKTSRVFLDLPDDMPTPFDGPLGFFVRKSRPSESGSSKSEEKTQSRLDRE